LRHAVERIFVWAGGALFLGSLTLLVLTYGRTFNAVPGFNGSALIVDLLLITVFALHHSLFARDWAKRAMARAVPERLVRAVYVWIASLLLVALCLLWQNIGGDIYRATGAAAWLVGAIQPIGLALIASSVTAINPLELAGIRAPTVRDALQSRGPYGLVRHPLYLGWLFCVFGDTNMTIDRLVFAIATTVYLFLAIPWEERSLEREFPSSYAAYKRQVKWRVIPYVY
jgi:protein-S-isoprenylcysteine O-methyltransferase Ste14